jgi:hypothetical protein
MSTRTGFIMRSFIPLGPLTVSRGFGGMGDEIIVFPEEELLKAGKGRLTEITATAYEAPLAIVHKTRQRKPRKKQG